MIQVTVLTSGQILWLVLLLVNFCTICIQNGVFCHLGLAHLNTELIKALRIAVIHRDYSSAASAPSRQSSSSRPLVWEGAPERGRDGSLSTCR